MLFLVLGNLELYVDTKLGTSKLELVSVTPNQNREYTKRSEVVKNKKEREHATYKKHLRSDQNVCTVSRPEKLI